MPVFRAGRGNTVPTIKVEEILNGDVLATDVIVNDVVLFTAGTVLNTQRIEILRSVKMRVVEVEDRYKSQATGMDAVLQNIDARFSYVEKKPFMIQMRSWIKDVLMNLGDKGGR